MDLILTDLGMLQKNLKKYRNAEDILVGISLVVRAGLVDWNAIHHIEIMWSVEGSAVLKVWLELVLTAVLVLWKLAMAVG